MQELAVVMVPFFAVVVCGYIGAKRGLVPSGVVTTLNTFVFYFALPALIIRSLATQELEQIVDFAFVAAYLAAWFLLFVITAIGGRLLFATTPSEAIIQGYGGSYPNTGYLGFPVLVAVLGDWATTPVASIIAADIAVTVPVVLLLLEACQSTATNWIASLKHMLLRTISQPLLIAVMIGLALAASGLGLPTAIDNTMQFLGFAAGPCALFALGASLANRPFPKRYAEITYLSLAKLIVHPAIAWFFMVVVFPVNPSWVNVGLLAAALPTAATVFVLAEHYHTHVVPASSTILITTLVSLVTFPTLAYFVLV